MILRIYAIHDSKVGAFMRPFVARSDGEAIRAFSDIANEPSHEVCKHAEDYTLFASGEFDDGTGEVRAIVPPTSIAQAFAVKRQPKVSAAQQALFERANGRDPDLVLEHAVGGAS